MALNVPRLHGPIDDSKADSVFIGVWEKNMNRKETASFRFGSGRDLGAISGGEARVLSLCGEWKIDKIQLFAGAK
jgi:hypothetical protein